MRYLSLFSGVEAASVAWERLGWEPVAFAEIDPFPSAVLAHRFPNVPNLGDVSKVDWREFHERYGAVDVLIGGSPCQSFSIAGDRTGLEGASGLMWQFCRAVGELVEASGGGGPRYVLWENVPGALSSGPKGQKGEDFGCLLRELEKCGYGLAWRVLDSQFARVPDRSAHGFAGPVPQRRRRVFLVGSLGTDGAGDILFERTCLRGDHPKGREAREALAEHLDVGAEMGDSAGFKYHQGGRARGVGYESGQSPTLTADYHQPAVVTQDGDDVSRTITARMDSSPSVEGRGPSIVMQQPAGFKWYAGARARGIGYEEGTSPTIAVSDSHVPSVLTPWDVQSKRVNTPAGTSPTLPSGTGEGMNIQPIVMTTANTNANGSNVNQDGACYTLDGTNSNAVAFAQNTRDEVRLFGGDGQTVGALSAQPGMKQTSYVCMQDGQAKGAIEDGLSTTLNASHEQPIAVYFGDCGLRKGSDECDYAKYSAEHGSATYEYVCCSCGHRFMSGDGPVNTEMDEDWYRIRCPKCGSGRYVDASRAKTICAADDNGKTAIEEDLCGSLKVGGGPSWIAASRTCCRTEMT